MSYPRENTEEITDIILKAAENARAQTSAAPERPQFASQAQWPIECLVGPGLEGAIACESKIGYVNGAKGSLIYRGYDIFDLCAYSSFEEVSYLLLHGEFPTKPQFDEFKKKLGGYRRVPSTFRVLTGFPLENMNPMAALRLGVDLMRQEFTSVDAYVSDDDGPVYDPSRTIGTDEDSMSMEIKPFGEQRAIYEFARTEKTPGNVEDQGRADDFNACYHLLAGSATIAGAITRIRQGKSPIDPDPELSYAANLIYMMTGERPSAQEERLMDICLILHADHGMNASTFASMVVASTLSDLYFSVGAGIGALNGPLHGGANEQVIHMLNEIGSVNNVKSWYENARTSKKKIMGFGHRVYKAYDPRARVLGPLAEYMIQHNDKLKELFGIAQTLEKEVVASLGSKGIFPNVDFYSGILYSAMGIESAMFTPVFAVSRVAGWTARVMEYMENNRIFRPRALYIGEFDRKYVPIEER